MREYVAARKWTGTEYVDSGVSGTKESRPTLDGLLKDARRRKFDALVVWRFDRLGRNLKHLLVVIDELQSLGIAFVSLHEGIDATIPAGRLQLQMIGAFAEFERNRIIERVKAGLIRAKLQGKTFGRPKHAVNLSDVSHLSAEQAAKTLGISVATIYRRRRVA